MNNATNLSDFQKAAVELSLKRLLLTERSFSITTFDYLAKTLEISDIPASDYQSLRVLHCVDYVDMGAPMVKLVKQKVLEVLGLDSSVIDVASSRAQETDQPSYSTVDPVMRTSFWKRLTNG